MLENLFKLLKENIVAAGVFTMFISSIVVFILRDMPAKLLKSIFKYITVSVTFASTDETYEEIILYLTEKENLSNRLRNIKYFIPRYTTEKDGYKNRKLFYIKGFGYGYQIFWLRGRFVYIDMTKDSNTYSEQDKEYLTIKYIGFSHKFVNKLVKDAQNYIMLERSNTISTYVYKETDDMFRYNSTFIKRDMDSIYFKDDILKKLNDAIANFYAPETENWYKKHSIPYHFTILLYGPPGTGKTSIAKALASKYTKDLYIITPSDFDRVDNSGWIQPYCFMLADDIDRNVCLKKNPDNTVKNKDLAKLESSQAKILALLDGSVNHYGRVIIMTANDLSDIEPKVLRPGRIDLMIEIGYMDTDTLVRMLDSFADGSSWRSSIVVSDYEINEKVTGAMVQNSIMIKKSYEEIFKDFTHLKT